MRHLKMRSIDYYYDFVSIPAWIMFERLISLQNRNNFSINYFPIHVQTVTSMIGMEVPYSKPALKKNYFEEQRLFSRLHGISINTPRDVIDNLLQEHSTTLLPQLTLNLLKTEYGQSKFNEFSRTLWRRLWIDNKFIHNEGSIKEMLAEINIDQKPVMELLPHEKWFELLNSHHMKAFDLKCFGVPWIVLNFEDGTAKNFFGSDRWPLICHHLQIPCKSFGDIQLPA